MDRPDDGHGARACPRRVKASKGVEAAVRLSYAPPTTIFIPDDVDLTR